MNKNAKLGIYPLKNLLHNQNPVTDISPLQSVYDLAESRQGMVMSEGISCGNSKGLGRFFTGTPKEAPNDLTRTPSLANCQGEWIPAKPV